MHRLLSDVSKFVTESRKSGFSHAVRLTGLALRTRIMRKSDRKWEHRSGVRTQENLRLESLDVASENKPRGFSYVPAPERVVRVALANLPDDLSRYTFIDFGSGEGRVLLVAATFPFRQVIGVEFAKELHQTAESNIAQVALSPAARARITARHLDATQFEIPRQPCVLYFYNPFGEQVLDQVLQNIELAHRECGQTMYVIYQRVAGDSEDSQSRNVQLLRDAVFLRERPVHFPSLWDRILLGSHESYLFETCEPGREVV